MTKVLHLSQNINQFDFIFPHNRFDIYHQSFLSTELGKIYQNIPWSALVKTLRPKRRPRGQKPLFDDPGQLALMFLKAYTGYSDRKLVERLNTDYSFQFFCGIYLHPGQRLENLKIVSKIRCRLAKKISIAEFQQALAVFWKKDMKEKNVFLVDATCYETNMRYPTNVKLLWEANEWVYGQIKRINKVIRGRMPRSKFAEQKTKYLSYQRNKKKSHIQARRRVKSLLYLLNKLFVQLDEIEKDLPAEISLPKRYHNRKTIISKVYDQQRSWYETKEKPKDLIVSIDKSYIRPIVRGKETKRVEFGPKVNMIQIDGINFIEHLSFDAFHEGIRLIPSIYLTQSLTHTKCTHLSGDRIYATNANRSYCTAHNITTNFIRKGKAGKHEKHRQQISQILSKERATRMEGSFGTEKNHYSLRSIGARTKKTEILWVLFGVHTANLARIVAKKANAPPVEKAA